MAVNLSNVSSRKEGYVLFNDALNTFYLRLYGIRHIVKNHSDMERENPLPPHRLLFRISSKGSVRGGGGAVFWGVMFVVIVVIWVFFCLYLFVLFRCCCFLRGCCCFLGYLLFFVVLGFGWYYY